VLVVYLRLPWLRPVVELITLLPLVLPPIVLVIGVGTVLRWGPNELAGTVLGDFLVGLQDERLPWILVFVYVVLAMPFAYRSLDAGIRAVDLHTLVEAARSLGASWPAVVGRVVVPVLRTAVLNAAFLTLALVLGEYTIARLLLFKPFPVWVVEISGAEAQLSVSVSILSLGLAWFLLIAVSSLGGRRGRDTTLRSL
jgi:putative spermidine/putrescine transport system permease protein